MNGGEPPPPAGKSINTDVAVCRSLAPVDGFRPSSRTRAHYIVYVYVNVYIYLRTRERQRGRAFYMRPARCPFRRYRRDVDFRPGRIISRTRPTNIADARRVQGFNFHTPTRTNGCSDTELIPETESGPASRLRRETFGPISNPRVLGRPPVTPYETRRTYTGFGRFRFDKNIDAIRISRGISWPTLLGTNDVRGAMFAVAARLGENYTRASKSFYAQPTKVNVQ